MKKYISIFIFLLSLQLTLSAQEDFRKQAPAPGPAPVIKLGESKQVTLKNGLKVIVVENHKLPVINIQLFVDYPPILEGSSAGFVDMAGQMLSKGTTTRTKAQIDEAVDFIGASFSTSASGVNGSCLTRHKDKLLEIMTDVLFNPSFPPDEFEKLKKQTISALAQAKDDPEAIAANVSARVRNGRNHPYGEIETEETITSIKVEECKGFYDTYFQPGISYLIITGDIATQEALNLASRYFSKWENHPVKKPLFETPQKPEATTVNFVNKVGAVQSVINITYPIDLKPGSPDVIQSSVLNTVLGAYFGSRLNTNLREDKAYTYGARSVINPDPLIGYFNANASVRNEVTDSSIVQFLYEMEQLQKEPIPEDELRMVKNYITGSFARSLEDPSTVARFTLNTARYGLPSDYYATYLEKLNAVTANDIKEMAQTYLTIDQAHIVVVGNKDEVAEKLLPFSKQGKGNYYDVYGNILEEKSMPVPNDVTATSVLSDYLNAIGGKAKLNDIKTIIMVMNAEIQGVTIESVLYHSVPNKLSMSNKMLGNIIQQSVYDGNKGFTVNMGTAEPMSEDQLSDMKIDGRVFPERFYDELGVKTTLKGIELVEGDQAYRIDIEYPSGAKKTNYFDVDTKLKIRELDYQDGNIITKDIGDYKSIEGILFPHLISATGLMPVPLVMKTSVVEVNSEISAELFKVE